MGLKPDKTGEIELFWGFPPAGGCGLDVGKNMGLGRGQN
jgi:hypothetical protein